MPALNKNLARALLKEVNTLEKVMALSPEKRAEYLSALDAVYGNKSKRAADMGFGSRTWYHGSTVDIPEFSKKSLGASTGAQSAKKGFFFASDASTAGDYAQLAAEKGVTRKSLDLQNAAADKNAFIEKMQDKYGKSVLSFGDQEVVPGWQEKMTKAERSEFSKLENDYAKKLDLQTEDLVTGSSGFSEYVEARAKLHDLETRGLQEKRRIENINKWNEEKGEKWVKQAADRMGQTVDEYIKDKISAFSEKIEPASKSEIDAARKDYFAKIREFASKNDPEYVKKIFAIDTERLAKNSDEYKAFAEAEKYGKDINESLGQQVGSYRLRGNPDNIHVKNYKGQGYRDTTYSDEMQAALEQGKEGVLFKNTYDPADPANRVKQDIAAVFDPEQIRSTNAAFDPRFKKSPNVLAGGFAMPTQSFADVLGDAGDWIKNKTGLTDEYMEKMKWDLARKSASIGNPNPSNEQILNAYDDISKAEEMGTGFTGTINKGSMVPLKGGDIMKQTTPTIDLDVIEALVKNGKLKPETLATVQKYCSGGKVKKMADGGMVDGDIEQLTGNLNVAQMDPAEVAKLGASYQSPEEMLRSKEVDSLVGRGYEEPAKEEAPQDTVPPMEGSVAMVANDRQQAIPEGMMQVGQSYDPKLDQEIAKSAIAIGSGQQNVSREISSIANSLREQADADERIKASRQIEMDKVQSKLDAAMADYSTSKVDPNRFFAEKSTGQKIAMAIGLFFSGIGGSHAGMQLLDSAINRDIEAQKADIAAKQGKVQGYRGVYSDMLNRFHNEDMATAATRTALLNVAELNLKSKLANIEGQKGYNEGLVRLQELGLRKAQAMQQFKNATIVSQQFQEADEMTKKVMSIPGDSTRNKALEEMGKLASMKQSLKTIDDVYNNAPGPAGYIPGTTASAVNDTNFSKLFTITKSLVGEKMSDGEAKLMVQPWVPSPKDPPWVLEKKKTEFKKWVNSKLNEQTPILTGLGLVKPQKTITEGKAK